jgi:uncharacterized protein YbaR (Trm112 family)
MVCCPECNYELKSSLPFFQGEIIACPVCGTELEVTKEGNLVVLQLEGEDWGE